MLVLSSKPDAHVCDLHVVDDSRPELELSPADVAQVALGAGAGEQELGGLPQLKFCLGKA